MTYLKICDILNRIVVPILWRSCEQDKYKYKKRENIKHMSFASYKKSRTDLTSLNKKVEEIAEGTRKSFKDERIWRVTVDKAGSGSARLRFLSAPDGEDLPWVQYHEHNFSINGSYFIELCPTTLGRECPVCKANNVLWNLDGGVKENQDIVRNRKRKLVYISNIYVIKDKENTETEGKVYLYQYGQKIFEKIKMALKPKDEDDPAVNVFDFWEGADFALEVKNVAGYRNYDDSKFRAPSALLSGDDKKLEEIYKKLYPLLPFKDEKKFKSYEELEKKFNDVISGVKGKVQKKADQLFPETAPVAADAPAPKKERKPKETATEETPWKEPTRKPKASSKKEPKTEPTVEDVPLEDNDALNYYEQLAEEN